MTRFAAALAPTLALAAALLGSGAASAQTPPPTVALTFAGGDGSAKGTGTLTAAPTGVLIRIEATGLAPGWHGLHLHMTGACVGPKFETAGGHMTHAGAKHGLLNPDGPEDGDLPNVWAGADGSVHAEVFTTRVSLAGEGGRPALRDADGASLMIHAAADDQSTPPTGGSGARAACAVIPPR
jgi:Cu-Zn family superoxide dismutase